MAALNLDCPKGTDFMRPELPFDFMSPRNRVEKRLYEEFHRFGVSPRKVGEAFEKAKEAQSAYKADVRKFGDETVAYLEANGGMGVVLAGHPYHLDPEVHHGIPELIAGCGAAVFTEDSICHKAE